MSYEAGWAVPLALIIIAGVALALLYFFYRRYKRLPWQKKRGTPYTVPVAIYHEVCDIRSQMKDRHDYDYAEPIVEFSNLKGVKMNRDAEEYDHLGDNIPKKRGQYHTPSSAVQELKRSPSHETPCSDTEVYSYSHLNEQTASKVLNNKYEPVIPLNQGPRSPVSLVGSSSEYNYLALPQKQSVITSEYDTAYLASNKKPTPKKRSKKKDGEISKPVTQCELAKSPSGNSAGKENTEVKKMLRNDQGCVVAKNEGEDSSKAVGSGRTTDHKSTDTEKGCGLAKRLVEKSAKSVKTECKLDEETLNNDTVYVLAKIVGKVTDVTVDRRDGRTTNVDKGSVMTRLDDERPDTTDQQVYDVPRADDSQIRKTNGIHNDVSNSYSVAGPIQPLYDRQKDKSVPVASKRRKNVPGKGDVDVNRKTAQTVVEESANKTSESTYEYAKFI